MAFQVQIDAPANLAVVMASGGATLEDVTQFVAGQLDTLRTHPYLNVLYDGRELDWDPAPHDVVTVANLLFQAKGICFGRIALIVSPGPREGLARIFVALANFSNISADVFVRRADALAWLTPAIGQHP